MIGRTWCGPTHHRHWSPVARKTTGTRMPERRRHVGAYRRQVRGRSQRVVGDLLRNEDSKGARDGPPDRGLAMALHRLLGGKAGGG